MARPWTVLNEPMNAAEIKFGNVTYHFWLVAAEDVEGGYMSRPPDAQDPIAIIESIHDFNFVAETVGARLEVSARVAGVHVSVNGRPQGITDASGSLIVKGLKAGDYDVQLSVNGYTDFHRRVTLNYGKTERITAVLEPLHAVASAHEEFVTRQEDASASDNLNGGW